MAVFMIILSVLVIAGGISCMVTPVATFFALGWLVGIAVMIVGISSVFRYAAGHNGRSIWELIGGICGILFGLFEIVNVFARVATNIVLAYAAALWLLIHGICAVIEALKLRRINKRLPDIARSSVWLVAMILGILIVAMGIASVIQPMFTMISVGWLMGISIVASGVKTLVFSIQSMRNK